jgi:hypothetical protein
LKCHYRREENREAVKSKILLISLIAVFLMGGNAFTFSLGNEITMHMVGGLDFFDAKCASAHEGDGKGQHDNHKNQASIPDATTLVLLGSAMVGVGVFGRKKVFKRS